MRRFNERKRFMSLLGIDLGTTGCKAGVFGLDGACLAQAYREYDMLHPQPGWSELDSSKVWKKTKEVIAEVAAQSKNDPITALSISAFGEAFVPVSKVRKILDNSILCVDDRGREHTDRLLEEFGQEKFYAINPNLIGPNFSLPKLLWLREHRAEVFEQADYFLLWSDAIAFLLGCEPVTNNSHANRTLLFDLDKNDWSDELLAWSGIPREKLGRIVCGGDVIGTVSDSMAADTTSVAMPSAAAPLRRAKPSTAWAPSIALHRSIKNRPTRLACSAKASTSNTTCCPTSMSLSFSIKRDCW